MSVSIVVSRLAAQLRLLAPLVVTAFSALLPMPALAQQDPDFFGKPYAPGQYNIGRPQDQSELRYCVDPRDPSWQVDGDIADAIAQELLLQPKRYVVTSQMVTEDLSKVYAILLKNCDVYMGFKLIPEGYPDWVTLTRSYDHIGYVFVTAKPEIHAVSDLPPGRPIAVTLGTTADYRLASFNLALAPEKRWAIFPYGIDTLSLGGVLSGDADVALVWGPSFWSMQQQNPAYAPFHIIDSAPLPPTTLGVGGLLLKQNAFLRTNIDQAITALIADGTIQGILDKYKYPATAKP